ncbi:hypothetical protein [Streptomyces smaragdinus]|nr:hypothetical protein [Streptomyces smaragdinus]
MRLRELAAGIAAGAVLAGGTVLGAAAPAQAYDPDPTVADYHPATTYCPCSGGDLADPFDGTYFAYDAGNSMAYKTELYKGDWFVGKVEFHPLGEELWVYDTRNDGDTIYVELGYYAGTVYHRLARISPNGTDAVVDKKIWNGQDIPEDAQVEVKVYDDDGYSDWITESTWARA